MARISQASGLMAVVLNLSILLGFSIAPLIFVPFGASWSIAINAITFGIAILAIVMIKAPVSARSVVADEKGHMAREFSVGLRCFFRSRVLRTILMTFVVPLLGAGALNALYDFFLTQNLHAPVSSPGLFTVILGTSLLCGAVMVTILFAALG